MIWVQRLLQSRHSLNHRTTLRVVQEGGLLLANAVLGRNATVNLAAVVHHEGLNDVLCTLLQASVLIARQNNVQVKVTITDMTVAIRKDQFSFLSRKLGRALNQSTSFVDNLVIVASRQADIVLECL